MRKVDHLHIVRALREAHREALEEAVAEQARLKRSLTALFTEELEVIKAESAEWERMYHEVVAKARELKARLEES